MQDNSMTKLLLIAGAGAAGAVSRYLLATGCQRLSHSAFPVGTMVVNLAGCLLIGFMAALFTGPFFIRDEYRTVLLIGFLGAFTTFSTYGVETFYLLNDGQKWAAASNVVLSNVLGLGLVWAGYRLAEKWYGG
jgi:CrcB protein